MKTSILIALGAVAALSGAARAQSSLDRQLEAKDFALRATPGVTLRARRLSEDATAYYLVATKASAAQVLEHIARVTGERLIAAPALRNSELKTFAANGSSLQDLIELTTSLYQLASKPIAPGARLFAFSPIESAGQWAYKDRLKSEVRDEQLADYNAQAQRERNQIEARAEQEKLRADPRYDPFVFPRGGLDPKDRFGRSIEPQPDWEKREFNGREFYFVPLPKP